MCDLLVALGRATASGHTLFAKNSDRPPGEPQRLEWFGARREVHTRASHVEIPGRDEPTIPFLGSRPDWMSGVEHGVNAAGLAAGNATIYTTLDPRGAPDALTGMDLVRLALERATTAGAAVDVITDALAAHGQGGSGHQGARRPYWSSFLLADPHEAFVLDTSGTDWAVEAVTDTRAASNRTSVAGFDALHRHPRQPVEMLVDPRLAAGDACLARRPVTAAGLQAHLRSHVGGDDGWTVCMHVDGIESTAAAIVAELPAAGPARAWVLAGAPCRSVFVPIAIGRELGNPVSWERFEALSHDARSALDELERRLASQADAPGWADDPQVNVETWARVDEALAAIGA